METTHNVSHHDIEALYCLVALQFEQLRVKDEMVVELQARLNSLYEQLRLMRAQRFGASSEVTPPDQYAFCFNEAEIVVAIDEQQEEKSDEKPVRRAKRPRTGSLTLPAGTPIETIEHDLAESDKSCPHDGHALHRIGEEISDQVDIQPAKVTIIRHVRPKYGCRCCEQGVHIAPMPPQALPGTIASSNTAALISVSKYVDHQPLYRQEKILARSDVHVSRATLAHWIIKLAELKRPLFNLMNDLLLSGRWIQMDETTVQVLREPGRAAKQKSYVWVRRTIVDGKTIILFHYEPSRAGEVARKLLDGFTGKYLQHDGYSAYEQEDEDEPPPIEGECLRDDVPLIHVGCMAHARRKFVEVIKTLPSNKRKGTLAQAAIGYIDRLYRIETAIRDMSATERYRVRQEKSVPLLNELADWWQHKQPAASPNTKIGKALGYLQRQWPKLIRYCDDGELEIDNNLVENAIRPFALGRKNWMFATSTKGAEASAIHYSILATAQANGHDPYHYERYIYKELPKAKTVEDIERLLPWNLDPESLRNL